MPAGKCQPNRKFVTTNEKIDPLSSPPWAWGGHRDAANWEASALLLARRSVSPNQFAAVVAVAVGCAQLDDWVAHRLVHRFIADGRGAAGDDQGIYTDAGAEGSRRGPRVCGSARRRAQRYRAKIRPRLHRPRGGESGGRPVYARGRPTADHTRPVRPSRCAAAGDCHQPGTIPDVLLPAGRRPGGDLSPRPWGHRQKDAARRYERGAEGAEPDLVSAAFDPGGAARAAADDTARPEQSARQLCAAPRLEELPDPRHQQAGRGRAERQPRLHPYVPRGYRAAVRRAFRRRASAHR